MTPEDPENDDPQFDDDHDPVFDGEDDCPECPACHGDGMTWDGLGECRNCGGDGYIDS